MADFTRYVNYNASNSPFQSIVFGNKSPLLEVELNEMQSIMYERIKTLQKEFFGDGVDKEDTITYANNVLTLNGRMLLGGHLITCDNITINVTGVNDVYVNLIYSIVDQASTIRDHGFVDGAIIPNTIKDDRYPFPTTKRMSIEFSVDTVAEAGHENFYLGYIDLFGKFHRKLPVLGISAIAKDHEAETVTIDNGYRSVFTTGNGQDVDETYTDQVKGLVDIKLEGMTVLNAVSNGDFSNGITDFSSMSATTTVSGNEATITASATSGGIFYQRLYNIKPGDKIYYSASVKATTNLARVHYYDGITSNNVFHSGSGNYERLSGVTTQGASPTETTFAVKDNRTSGWTPIYVKDVMIVNLTQIFGVGYEPSVQDCDMIFDHYINGLQGVSDISIASVGKNLIDLVQGSYDGVGNLVKSDIRITHAQGMVAVKSNTSYTLSLSAPLKYIIQFLDKNKNPINASAWSNSAVSTYTFTTPLNAGYINIAFKIDDTTKIYASDYKIQLEEGSVATEYESYKASKIQYTFKKPLHKLPNGLKDEVIGEQLIRRTKEYVVQPLDVTQFVTNFTNVDIVGIKLPQDYIGSGTDSSVNKKQVVISSTSYVWKAFVDSTTNVGTFHYITGVSRDLAFCVPKGTYANIASAQSAFAGMKIIYQLNTDRYYESPCNEIKIAGCLEAYSHGTVSQEPLFRKSGLNAKTSFTYNLSDKSMVINTSKAFKDETKTKKVGRYNPNLLINSDFKVWSNGEKFTTTNANIQVANKWYALLQSANHVVEKVDDGLRITRTSNSGGIARLTQTFTGEDAKNLRNKTLTFSGEVDTNVFHIWYAFSNGVIVANNTFSNYDTQPYLTFKVPSDCTLLEVFFQFADNGVFTVHNTKLEEGSVVTPFIPNTYHEDIIECERYDGNSLIVPYSNPNALINGDFKIWQRGESFSYPNGSFTADRWGASCIYDTNHRIIRFGKALRVETYGAISGGVSYTDIWQKVEDYLRYAGKTITFSVNVDLDAGVSAEMYISDGVGGSGVYSISSSGTKSITFTVNSAPVMLFVAVRLIRTSLAVGKGITINWVKLELGSVATAFVPRIYGEELALCQRYFWKPQYQTDVRCAFISGNYAQFNLNTPVPMRVNPVCVGNPNTDYQVVTMNGGSTGGGFTFSVARNGGGVTICATKASHGLTDACFTCGTGFGLDAEL